MPDHVWTEGHDSTHQSSRSFYLGSHPNTMPGRAAGVCPYHQVHHSNESKWFGQGGGRNGMKPSWQRPRGLCAVLAFINNHMLILSCSAQWRLSRVLWQSWCNSKSQIQILWNPEISSWLWTTLSLGEGLYGTWIWKFQLFLYYWNSCPTPSPRPSLINSHSYISFSPQQSTPYWGPVAACLLAYFQLHVLRSSFLT